MGAGQAAAALAAGVCDQGRLRRDGARETGDGAVPGGIAARRLRRAWLPRRRMRACVRPVVRRVNGHRADRNTSPGTARGGAGARRASVRSAISVAALPAFSRHLVLLAEWRIGLRADVQDPPSPAPSHSDSPETASPRQCRDQCAVAGSGMGEQHCSVLSRRFIALRLTPGSGCCYNCWVGRLRSTEPCAVRHRIVAATHITLILSGDLECAIFE